MALIVAAVSLVAGLCSVTSAQATLLLPKVPLFVNLSTTPNIFMQMDDSGSMDWDIMTASHFTTCRYNYQKLCDLVETTGEFYDWTGKTSSGSRIYRTFEYVFSSSDDAYSTHCYNSSRDVIELCGTRTGSAPWDWRVRSTSLNVLFFNPGVEYSPWPGYSNADFASARSYPDNAQPGYSDTRNLAGFYYYSWIDDKGFVGSQPDKTDVTQVANGIVDEWDSYVKVTVNATSYSCALHVSTPNTSGLNTQVTSLSNSDSSCIAAVGVNTSAAMLSQNVANWYQYYRRRALVTRAAVARVITDLSAFRYGFSFINEDDVFVQVPDASVNDYSQHNQNLIQTYIANRQKPYGTPLRRGLERIGRYYDHQLSGKADPILYACQKNFAVLYSDGYWNGLAPQYVTTDVDGDGGVVFQGTSSQTKILLADVARYYYINDLSPLPDLVPTDQFDSANHQHMVTFPVGFGITGSLYDLDGDGWPDNLNNGLKWYTATSSDEERVVDDLWHAAWNSRGQYISAARPEEVISELTKAIEAISERIGGAASGATNGGSISSESTVFQAKFDAFDWHGSLLAIDINPLTGELDLNAWEAGVELNAMPNSWFLNARKVFTIDPATQGGRLFTWNGITAAQQAWMNIDPETGVPDSNGGKRLNYIRGSSSDEGTLFRSRAHRLGDITHSDPEYVAAPPFFYALPGYQAFAIANQDRMGVIYVGANDGMLHAFRETDGSELFSYVPAEIIHKLPKLTSDDYFHEYYVDGSPVYGDIETATGWRSVLIGGLRGGGQGLYALDITNPESFGTNEVLWEFTDENDADLGYVFGEPQIRKMADGRWRVIFTSGYNNTEADGFASPQGQNYLYLLDIEAGANGWQATDYTKILVPGSNGLSAPAPADVDGDHITDFIYVGDLDGNLWKIDVTSQSPAGWGLSFGGQPLYVARNASGERQAITSLPAVMTHPLGIREGVLLLFGTGKYIEVNDDSVDGAPTQSIYGIWDRDGYYNKALNQRNSYGAHGFDRTTLKLPQLTEDSETGHRIIHEDYANTTEWLGSNGQPVSRGWALDLPEQGERVIRKVILRDNMAFVVTLIPEDDVCSAGGTGWLMVLDAESGTAPRFPVLDITGDNLIQTDDTLQRINPNFPEGSPATATNPVGIKMLSIPNLPALLYDDRASDLGAVFPPRPNEPRGCGAQAARTFTYTTRTNGSIEMVAAAHQPLACGRQSWDQTH